VLPATPEETQMRQDFGWTQIARLGLVQAALGAVVVLTTSTLNRIMVVELALPALLPGVLVALHYLVQLARPGMGHGTDVTGRHTPWIIGGVGLLAIGGVGAALGVVWMSLDRPLGMALAMASFTVIGLGVSAGGTSLLTLLAKRVASPRRAAAATIVWMMMIAGFAVTAGVAGKLLDPYSPERLMQVTATVSAAAFVVTVLALFRLEGAAPVSRQPLAPATVRKLGFREALAQVWSEPAARQFTVFVFISMLAYSAQDLILEPFAGTVFGFTPGASTQLSGVQHGGVLMGMIIVALACGSFGKRFGGERFASLRAWSVGGCLASALALAGLGLAGFIGPVWPLKATVFALGVANGAFSIAAIGSMMRLAGQGHEAREGVRMGLWGAAQAIAFGLGGLVGTGASDLAHWLIVKTGSGQPGTAYASVFICEAALFIVSAALAARIGRAPAPATEPTSTRSGRLPALRPRLSHE